MQVEFYHPTGIVHTAINQITRRETISHLLSLFLSFIGMSVCYICEQLAEVVLVTRCTLDQYSAFWNKRTQPRASMISNFTSSEVNGEAKLVKYHLLSDIFVDNLQGLTWWVSVIIAQTFRAAWVVSCFFDFCIELASSSSASLLPAYEIILFITFEFGITDLN